MTTTDLLRRLYHVVQAEAATQYQALEQQWNAPLSERVAKGWAIEGLHVERIDGETIYLVCDTNISRFREGDLVALHRGNPRDPNALHLELTYDGEQEIEASLVRGNVYFLTAEPDGWIIDQDWFDASQFYLDALNTVADSHRGRALILPLLNGSLIPKVDFARYDRCVHEIDFIGLNDSQIEAVAQAYAVDLLHLIQGPPGTGKTLMLAHLAKLLVRDGQRVLVTALTHRAIHNALNKIIQVDEHIPVCKIGNKRLIGDLNVPNYENFTESKFESIHGGYVVGATPFALLSQRLANVEFDVILFDEASQITLPLAIMGMLAGNKYIFIGDDNQLPPVTILDQKCEQQPAIFSYLAGRGNETMLNITYRLNDALTHWPSRTFYGNQLKSSQEAAGRRLQLVGNSSRWDFVLDPAAPVIFLDLCHRNTTVRSLHEAEVVVELIQALLDHHIQPDDIGVVVPYRAQSRLIRTLLRRAVANKEITDRIVVDTVERMQGQEREVILVSFATSSSTFASMMAGFIFQPQRLNVAITRPRTKLIMVGSRKILSAQTDDPDNAYAIKLMQDLVDHCQVFTVPDGSLIR
ncbi:MAG TPA: AAA domain-containing protein [Anaerolineaceae bacterium]|nr:AAA domain-containing protein [Anaerolineaceae bacterium]HPN53606.1 AAA domain-containing protein [Anaerolineaceae bacterium]